MSGKKKNEKPVKDETQDMDLGQTEGTVEIVVVGKTLNEILEQLLEKAPELQEQLENLASEKAEEALRLYKEESKADEDIENLLASKEEEITSLLEENENLKKLLEQSGKEIKAVKGSQVITCKKDLDPKKKYVTGESGIGYVEAKK